MKFFWLILAALSAFTLNAQTNSADTALWAVPRITLNTQTNPAAPAPVATTNTPPDEIHIKSDHWVGDLNKRVVVYSGQVVVTDQKMKMTCDSLTISASTNNSASSSKGSPSLRPDGGVAEGNVKIVALDEKGRPIYARSGKAIYSYRVENSVTNETITLTNNVYYDAAMGNGTADSIVWDHVNNTIHMEKADQTIKPEFKPAGTNAPPIKPVEKSSP